MNSFLIPFILGVKESDTGLAPPNLWDIPADKQRMHEEQPLQVRFFILFSFRLKGNKKTGFPCSMICFD